MELNLEQPIFTIYIDTKGMSHQMANESISNINDFYSKYTNATFWIIPSNINKVELVWSGSKYQNINIKDSNLQELIKHVNDVLQILSDGTSDASIKAQLRELQLSKILD
jgi:hypothetical protein